MRKPINVVRIPCSIDGEFFKLWLTFIKPLHGLTDREIDVAACLLKHRYHLSKVILDENLLNKTLLSEDNKREIKKECKVTTQYFHVILSNLRKAKLIINDVVNPKYIPNIVEDERGFQLRIIFDFENVEVDAI